MPKALILSLACLLCALCAPATATEIGRSESERLLQKHGGKFKSLNTDQITRDINETLLVIEDLCRQIKLAPKAEAEDVWVSGKRDYQLNKSEIIDSHKACDATLKALELEAHYSPENQAKAEDLREEARDLVRPHHKRQSAEYIRDLRNWLSISEGTLRRANEKRERESKK